MEFQELLTRVKNEPVFETSFLLAGDVDPLNVRKQLSRWVNSGKILQLRRGLYCLAQPYTKVTPHPFLIANKLVKGSYVSLQSALGYYNLIPEYVPVTTSVTTAHPTITQTPLGQFDFRHIQLDWFHSYHFINLGHEQFAFIATPEKALLDLVYLQAGGDAMEYLRSLRLQALDQINAAVLQGLAHKSNKPKLFRAVENLQKLIKEELEDYEDL